MSEMPFMTQLPSLPGAFDDATLQVLGQALDLLQGRGLFGLVWLDDTLIARHKLGDLASFIAIERPVTESVLALFGMEPDLLTLPVNAAAAFEMPNVAIVDDDGGTPRMNLQVYRMRPAEGFLLVISKVLGTGELEIGLAQQVRARMIVEAELASQAKALAALNVELMRANSDLSEFAYVISHDLKAPLRAMRMLAEDLEAAVEKGEGDPIQMAGRIKTQSRRMAQMLTDLLAYSKIGRKQEVIENVDTGDLVSRVVDSMPRPTSFRICLSGQWPAVETFAAPLDLILRNLIGNAINHHDRGHGCITVNCQSVPDGLQIEVIDDGPGIDAAWHEAIFKPFTTVSSTEDSDRSGIGLAIVKRAVESCGAKISLRSDPKSGRGAVFSLLWPVCARGSHP